MAAHRHCGGLVSDDHARLELAGKPNCLLAIRGFADNRDLACRLQQLPQAFPEQVMIIGQKDAEFAVPFRCLALGDVSPVHVAQFPTPCTDCRSSGRAGRLPHTISTLCCVQKWPFGHLVSGAVPGVRGRCDESESVAGERPLTRPIGMRARMDVPLPGADPISISPPVSSASSLI